MATKKELEKNLLRAIKARDELSKNAIRLAISSIKLAEVEKGEELSESEIFAILRKEIKMREETIAEAEKADRQDLIMNTKAEIEILKQFLPKELSDQELTELVKKIIMETGASSMKEMGMVIKKAIQEVHGRASNEQISKKVRELLA